MVALATVAAIAETILLSLDPGKYFFYHPADRAKWVYDPAGVAFVCGVMLAEATVLLVALVSPRPRTLWLRALLGLILLGPWALASSLFVLHLPTYVLFHHLWLWALVCGLSLIVVGSLSRSLVHRLRAPGE